LRFDPARMADDVRTLASPDPAQPGSESTALAAVAGALGRAGLVVERHETTGSPVPELVRQVLEWYGFWALMTLAGWRLVRGTDGLECGAAVVLALLWLCLAPFHRIGLGRGFFRRRVEWVSATRPQAAGAEVRVVFQAPTTGAPPLSNRRLMVLGWVFWVAFSVYLALILTELARRENVDLFVALLAFAETLLWVAYTILVWPSFRTRLTGRRGRKSEVNQSGLAVLLELGRTWPRATFARIETHFVATEGEALDRAGLRDLVRTIREVWEPKPTLIVALRSPGRGPRLALVAPNGAAQFAKAARDLWIPHVVAAGRRRERALWPIAGCEPEYVAILGDCRHGDGSSPNADMLRLAAQLAAEVALRWARKESPTAQEPGASRARSSQNPG
jgi:hypothetical protein